MCDIAALVLFISLALILRLRAAPNSFQCSSNNLTMFSEPFIEFISLRSSLLCSPNLSMDLSPFGRIAMLSELFFGFDSRYFVPLLHLPMASASKYCLWQAMRLEVKGDEAIRRKARICGFAAYIQ